MQSIPAERATSERVYLSIYLRVEDHYRMYKRETMDILTYLSDLGGLLGIVVAVGAFFTHPLVTRLMNAEMIGSTYQL